jgi:hypothetical protein
LRRLLHPLLQGALLRPQLRRGRATPCLLLECFLFPRELNHLLDRAIELGGELLFPFAHLLVASLLELLRRGLHGRRRTARGGLSVLVARTLTALLIPLLLRALLLGALLLPTLSALLVPLLSLASLLLCALLL